MSDLKEIAKQVRSESNMTRVKHDQESYVIYNGQLRQKILEIIREEFQDAKTVMELENRIISINIVKKITDALAQVYLNEPIREPVEEDENDQELIGLYSRSFDINTQMDFGNKMFKLTKHTLLEPYLNMGGIPKLRSLPSHTFTLFSDDQIEPQKMTSLVKHIHIDPRDYKQSRFEYWDNANHYIINGEGSILWNDMAAMGNEEGENPYGKIPFIHVTQQREILTPIPSTDVKSVQMAICLLLSDTALAQKYLSWVTLVISGGDGEERINIGPGAVVNLPSPPGTDRAPEIKYIQPDLNSDEVLRLIDKLVETLLSTNNLSAGTVLGKLTVGNAASGVAKMLDRLESTEDKEQQQKFFQDAEHKLWDLFSHYMLPVWVESGKLDKDYVGAFSPEFELSIEFPKVKVMESEKEKIENIIAKMQAGLISLRDAVRILYPDFDDEQIDEHIASIYKERVEEARMIERNLIGQEPES